MFIMLDHTDGKGGLRMTHGFFQMLRSGDDRTYGYLRKGGVLLGLLIGLLICAPQTAWADTTVTDSDALYDAINVEETKISLGRNVELEIDTSSSGVVIDGNVTIDLCGHQLTAKDSEWATGNVAMFEIGSSGSLTLTDSSADKTGKIDVGNNSSLCVVQTDGGEFTMDGGTIQGGSSQSAVNMNGGTFTMNGGTITGSYTTGNVSLTDGTMYANGGTISGQKALVSKGTNIQTQSGPGGTTFKGGVSFDGGTVGGGSYEAYDNYSGSVGVSGIVTISGGAFKVGVSVTSTNQGIASSLTITGGTFENAVTFGNKTTAAISGGTFNGAVELDENVTAGSSVTGGTFNGTFSAPLTVPTTDASVNVVFDPAGGSAVDLQSVVKGQKATKPTDPTKDHCIFAGWYKGDDQTAFDFTNTAITEALTLTAHWTPEKYALTVSGGAVTSPTGNTTGSYDYNSTVTITANAAPEGYQFKEWTGLDGVTITSGSKTSATVSFHMAGAAMKVEATYEEKPASGSSSGSGSSSSGSGSSGGSYSGSSTYIPPKEPEQETDKEPTLVERSVTEQQAVQGVYAWRMLQMLHRLTPIRNYSIQLLTQEQQKTLLMKLYPELTDELWEQYL